MLDRRLGDPVRFLHENLELLGDKLEKAKQGMEEKKELARRCQAEYEGAKKHADGGSNRAIPTLSLSASRPLWDARRPSACTLTHGPTIAPRPPSDGRPLELKSKHRHRRAELGLGDAAVVVRVPLLEEIHHAHLRSARAAKGW